MNIYHTNSQCNTRMSRACMTMSRTMKLVDKKESHLSHVQQAHYNCYDFYNEYESARFNMLECSLQTYGPLDWYIFRVMNF